MIENKPVVETPGVVELGAEPVPVNPDVSYWQLAPHGIGRVTVDDADVPLS